MARVCHRDATKVLRVEKGISDLCGMPWDF